METRPAIAKCVTFAGRVSACLLLGLILTIAIAWSCALWSPVPATKRLSKSSRWPAPPPAGWVATMVHEARGFGITDGAAMGVIPGAPNRPAQMVGLRAGWPFAAFAMEQQGSAMLPALIGPVWQGRLEPPAWLRPIAGRGLPALPLWRGLMLDTILFAAAIAGLVELGLLARRRRRRKRGQCLACGYALTGEPVCPECGRANPRVDSRP